MKAASKREQRKSLLLLCRAIAGSSARSAVKGERANFSVKRTKVKLCFNFSNNIAVDPQLIFRKLVILNKSEGSQTAFKIDVYYL